MRPSKTKALRKRASPAGGRTERHYHEVAEELYFILEGAGEIELDEERRTVGPGDAILIPSGTWHTIMAREPLRFLCCCAPPTS
jgi:mannose-6-phosphate isomerase-like protein (cupin superfamily)